MEQVQQVVDALNKSSDHTLMVVLVCLVGAILLVLAGVVAYRILKKLPKKQINEDIFKELADRKNLRDKLKAQLESADVDQREDIQSRIDKNEKAIKGLEKKAKLPKADS